jgi:DNA-binding NtrC family response regulator
VHEVQSLAQEHGPYSGTDNSCARELSPGPGRLMLSWLQPSVRGRFPMTEYLESAEKQIIIEALSTTNGVRTRTAELPGIDRRNLGYFLQKHAIRFPTNSRTEVNERGELSASAREPQMSEWG